MLAVAAAASARPSRGRHLVKLTIAHLLYCLGFLQLRQRLVLRRKAIVLMYHRVLTEEERRRTGSHPAIVVDRDVFARQMAVLKRRFAVLSVEEFADRIARKLPFPDSSCVITFDDGWRDNFTNALPILKRHQLPALVFLPVNYIGRRRLFWREALTQMLLRVVAEVRSNPRGRSRFGQFLTPLGLAAVLDISDPDPRLAVIDVVEGWRNEGANEHSGDRERLLQQVANELGSSNGNHPDRFMDWTEVAEMARHGVAFGGHTAEHRELTELSCDEARAEIEVSKAVVDAKVNPAVPTFSYPNGSWSPEHADAVRNAGYRLAFITRAGRVTCDDDPFTVRRINIDENLTHTPMFLARLVGLF